MWAYVYNKPKLRNTMLYVSKVAGLFGNAALWSEMEMREQKSHPIDPRQWRALHQSPGTSSTILGCIHAFLGRKRNENTARLHFPFLELFWNKREQKLAKFLECKTSKSFANFPCWLGLVHASRLQGQKTKVFSIQERISHVYNHKLHKNKPFLNLKMCYGLDDRCNWVCPRFCIVLASAFLIYNWSK